MNKEIAHPQYVCQYCDLKCRASELVWILRKKRVLVLSRFCDEQIGSGFRDWLQMLGLWERVEVKWERDTVTYILHDRPTNS